MAYLARRPGGSVQIRESVRGEHGPRSKTLGSFRGALSDHVLDQAERHAARPFDREALKVRAQAMGLGWESATNVAARALVKGLRRGRGVDPVLVGLLREGLEQRPEVQIDDALEEAADWLGSSDEDRGGALRGLLRLSDAIVRSRGPLPARSHEPFPLIDSEHRGVA